MKKNPNNFGEVVDLFCGIGALSYGLKQSGLKIVAGYDTDSRCKYAFEKNNGANFFDRDVAELHPSEIQEHFSGKVPSILAGCAPCQPFSTYKHRYAEDPRWSLVTKFGELAASVKPDYVTMENVPALLKYKGGSVFSNFCEKLSDAEYEITPMVAQCKNFGVPQNRRRLVVVASREQKLPELSATHINPVTVREAIGDLPPISAGESNSVDPLHISSTLSDLNLKRIKVSKPGGTWRDWPKKLRAPCHQRPSGATYSSVYARMQWDKPSPTVTTQCYGFGNGRFGHPEQDRAISLREAAILQSFPRQYEFVKLGEPVFIREIARWIGNAVPIRLAEAIGRLICS